MAQTRMVITISREEGSGGDEIALELARHLKLAYLDKEIIRLAATHLELPEAELVEFDEKGIPELKELRELAVPLRDVPLSEVLVPDNAGFGPVYKMSLPSLPVIEESQESQRQKVIWQYHRVVGWLIKEAAEQGRVVVVGRGANFVLKGWVGVVNIHIHAPLKDQIDRLTYIEKIEREVAAQRILESDRQRADFVRQYYGADWTNSDLYDLVVNTAGMPLQAATFAIAQFVKELDHGRPATNSLAVHRTYDRLATQDNYSLKEAADLLLLSPELLRHAVYNGELKAKIVEHQVISISREALTDWLHRSN